MYIIIHITANEQRKQAQASYYVLRIIWSFADKIEFQTLKQSPTRS